MLKVLWLMPPSEHPGEIPLVSQNRWFKYMPIKANYIFPVIAAYGVTMLSQAGFNVEFIDAPAEGIDLHQILIKLPRYDVLILEGRTAVMPWLWELVQQFKKVAPDLKIAVYGDHVMVKPEESIRHGFDYVVSCGDYDWGVLNLVKAIDAGGIQRKYVPKIFYSPLMKSLDELPFISRTLVNWRNYWESWKHREEFGWIQSGRGCWANCTYCSWNHVFYNQNIRSMSATKVFSTFKFIHETYGIREILDDADTFMMEPIGIPLANSLINSDLDIFWNIQTRADVVAACSVADLKLMARSGLHVVKLGVDGGNNYTLNRIQKGCTVSQIRKAVQKLKEANLEIHINMILGYPWENKKTAYDTIKFVKSLKPNQAQFGLIQPFFGTPFFEESTKHDWFAQDPYEYENWSMKQPILKGLMSSKEITQLYHDAWSKFYFSPGYMLHQLYKAVELSFKNGNIDALKHLWRGFKAVYYGHLRAVDQ